MRRNDEVMRRLGITESVNKLEGKAAPPPEKNPVIIIDDDEDDEAKNDTEDEDEEEEEETTTRPADLRLQQVPLLKEGLLRYARRQGQGVPP